MKTGPLITLGGPIEIGSYSSVGEEIEQVVEAISKILNVSIA